MRYRQYRGYSETWKTAIHGIQECSGNKDTGDTEVKGIQGIKGIHIYSKV